MVLADGATAPSSAQVKAGTDASDSPAPSGSMTLLTTGVSGGAAVNGLMIGATYDVYLVAEDLKGNLQASPQLVSSDITANAGALGLTCAAGTITNGGITINDTTPGISNNNGTVTINGPVTGTGGIALPKTGNGANTKALELGGTGAGTTTIGGLPHERPPFLQQRHLARLSLPEDDGFPNPVMEEKPGGTSARNLHKNTQGGGVKSP